MASAQIPGKYAVYIENPAGTRKLIMANGSYWWGPGGSSDGTVANTPEKWNYLGPSPVTGGPGYKIVVTYCGGAATSDASDGFWSVPVIVNGQQQVFGNSAHATGLMNDNFIVDLAAADVAYVASTETPVAIFRAKEGVRFSVGGGRVFMSIENNA